MKTWSKYEEARLLTLRAQGWTYPEIALEFDKGPVTICCKIGRLLKKSPCADCEYRDAGCLEDDCCDLFADWYLLHMRKLAKELESGEICNHQTQFASVGKMDEEREKEGEHHE